ncbi:MAG: hypothetical protein ABI480_13405 [Chitinophagaceae bacterium]
MKFLFLLLFGLTMTMTAVAQDEAATDSTGLPGDNFSLQGALEMFKKASSLEEFEKLINSQDNNINNLDLNEDGNIDYVKVIDKSDKNSHAFVLQVPVSETENQDIAVIELEKTGDTTAVLQIVGDEDIYGNEIIVEPDGGGDDEALFNQYNSSVAGGPSPEYNTFEPRIVVNVWYWPSVRFVYGPVYRPWVSPWRWNHYPGWWRPWRPMPWHAYHPLCVRYYRPFAVVHTHRVMYAHQFYRPLRVTSVTVRTRHEASVRNYRVTHTRTTVTGPRGHKVTHRSTTVEGPRGNKVRRGSTRRRR